VDIIHGLPARIQRLCEDSFGVNESDLLLFVRYFNDFFSARANMTNRGSEEPYLLSLKHRTAFTYLYLLFGIAASRDRLKSIISRSGLDIPIVGRIPENNMVSVVCIGGGPGTDMFAALAAQDILFGDRRPFLKFHIFDQAAHGWDDIVGNLLEGVDKTTFDYEYRNLRLPCTETDNHLINLIETITTSKLVTMFRFICDLCRQCEEERKESKKILRGVLLNATPGTIVYLADLNPSKISDLQPERVCHFLEGIFDPHKWKQVGFDQLNRRFQRSTSNELDISGMWNDTVRVSPSSCKLDSSLTCQLADLRWSEKYQRWGQLAVWIYVRRAG